ncbi:hypothetical protein OBRU01_02933 [Operophtera brumata]|uniref:Uncharacterized protein n=1 Tax=Operophtera brumata TaxID=104452 RepID=A0A0L7LNL7_OPEBR|nr:hypothetical protein OBRU01_02933 [Operophtera brumata]
MEYMGNLLTALFVAVSAVPAPGRIPKVYNALITSNQNLEPSKSYPVYQPVLHDPFGFSVQPSGLVPQPVPAKDAEALAPSPAAVPEDPPAQALAKEPAPPPSPAPDADSITLAPPPPPKTESPIPLNDFGLPPQVVPLGRINPAYNGFTQLGPFTYSYPGVRLYDPYDPFTLGPYGFPFYRPLPNLLGLGGPSYGSPSVSLVPAQVSAPNPAAAPAGLSSQVPPPEPSDLTVLNYSSKDPAIPNVPPPPLPQGGLKSDK